MGRQSGWNCFKGIEMTPESAAAEAFVSHLFSSMYVFFYPSQPTKELSLLCLLPFLKESPGRSFQERNLIYFETGNKRLVMNVKKEPVSRSVEGFCVWIFEMNHCEWKEPRGPFKKSALTWRLWTRNVWEPLLLHTFPALWWVCTLKRLYLQPLEVLRDSPDQYLTHANAESFLTASIHRWSQSLRPHF